MFRNWLVGGIVLLLLASSMQAQIPDVVPVPGQPMPGVDGPLLGPVLGPEIPAPLLAPAPGPNLGWAKFPGNALIPGSPYAPPPGGYVPPPPVPTPYQRCPCLNSMGVGCWASHDQFGCSSLHSTLVFQFGSCRQFFGEKCNQGPPQLPIPNGIGFRSIYPR